MLFEKLLPMKYATRTATPHGVPKFLRLRESKGNRIGGGVRNTACQGYIYIECAIDAANKISVSLHSFIIISASALIVYLLRWCSPLNSNIIKAVEIALVTPPLNAAEPISANSQG